MPLPLQQNNTENDGFDTSPVQPRVVLPEHQNRSDIAGKFNGLMWPRGDALLHSAAPMLLEYAQSGCPVDCGRQWSKDELQAAVEKGPHISALLPDAAAQLRSETLEKVKQGFCKIVKWKDIKDAPPDNLKISPIAMIPHKSRKYRAILDLSFILKIGGCYLPSVNDATVKQAPTHSIDQLGSAIPRLIEGMAGAPKGKLLFSKLDIKDGYWRMNVEQGGEWNFAYVLPPYDESTDIELVIPCALQMG